MPGCQASVMDIEHEGIPTLPAGSCETFANIQRGDRNYFVILI